MASLRAAITAKCKDCTYDPLAGGTYLYQIETCTITRCALWAVRPMTIATVNLGRKTRNEAVVEDETCEA